jgi:haloalkane dehalogenase
MATSTLKEFLQIPQERIELDGTELVFRRTGRGTPLLMIHGWPLNGATFRDHVAILRERFTCIVPDLPGSGASPWNPRTENMLADWGFLMAKLADTLELERFGVIAHDSGGTMARIMAAELGERVFAMVLANTELSSHVSPILSLLQKGLRLPGAHKIMAKAMSVRAYRRSSKGLGDCFGDLAMLDGDFHDACVAPLIEDAKGAIQAFTHLDLHTTDQLPAVHARMTAPTLLVWGENDPFFPLPLAREMLGELPEGSALEVIPDTKLFVHEEVPVRFTGLAETFLAKHLAVGEGPALRAASR